MKNLTLYTIVFVVFAVFTAVNNGYCLLTAAEGQAIFDDIVYKVMSIFAGAFVVGLGIKIINRS